MNDSSFQDSHEHGGCATHSSSIWENNKFDFCIIEYLIRHSMNFNINFYDMKLSLLGQ